MADQELLFNEFPTVSKKEWIEKISKDLKGKPLSDLQWQLEEQITLEAFYHPDDIDTLNTPLLGQQISNDWEIGEYIPVQDLKEAKKLAHEALMGGANALWFQLGEPLDKLALAQILSDIELRFISTQFGWDSPFEPLPFLELLHSYLDENEILQKDVEISLNYNPLGQESRYEEKSLTSLLQFNQTKWPSLSLFKVDGSMFFNGQENTSTELAQIIALGSDYLAFLTDQGLTVDRANSLLNIAISVDSSYFLDIAKIRALKILWLNLLEGYGVADGHLPKIEVHFSKQSQHEDPHHNMIQAATQAMAGAIGGANRLFVQAAKVVPEDDKDKFYRRIARNVQHLLKMESYFDRVVDPAAGSYYIEQLTTKLAEIAWEKFKKIESQKNK